MSLTPPTPDELRAFRQATGMSQAALADALGASKRAIENWEGGSREAPAMLRLALAAVDARLKPWGAPEVLVAQLLDDRSRFIAMLLSLEESFGIRAGADLAAHDAQIFYLKRQLSITDAALAREGALPETRIEVTQSGEYRAWVGGNPLVERDGSDLSFRTVGKAADAIEIATRRRAPL